MNSTVIYIGVGDGQGIDAVLDEAPNRLILIEPNPKLASKLRLKFENLEGVEVYELAVAATRSEKTKQLVEYNWNKASSIAETNELSRAYPGLKKSNTYPVECMGIEELVDKLNLNNSDENSLVIEAPGVEGEIVSELCKSGKVSLFEQLEITCSRSGFYATETKEEDLVNQLKQFGFELKFRDSDDPDWQKLALEKNKWLDELIASRKQINELTSQLDQLTNEKEGQSILASERQAQLEQASKIKDEQAKLAAERAVELEQLTKQKEEQSKLAAERQAQLEELTKQKELLTARVSELEALHAEETKSLQFKLKESEESREVLSARVSELENLRQQETDSFESRLVEASGSSEELREKLANLEKEYFEARRSGDLSQKMITKSQLDLDDLRNKYANKVASENELIELVQELRQKLQLASQYYFELQKEHPELISAPEGF